jgi:transposase-like protein
MTLTGTGPVPFADGGHQMARSYTPAIKKKVIQYCKTHSLREAAEKFDMPISTVGNWVLYETKNQTTHRKRYTAEEKARIVAFSEKNSLALTVQKFNVSHGAIIAWRKKGQVHGRSGNRMSAAEKRETMDYAKIHGIPATAKKFEANERTIRDWFRNSDESPAPSKKARNPDPESIPHQIIPVDEDHQTESGPKMFMFYGDVETLLEMADKLKRR